MSSVASTFSYRFQTSGSCFGPSLTEPARGEGDVERLAAVDLSPRDHRGRVPRQLLEPGAVRAVDVAAQAEAEPWVPGRRAVELRLDGELEAGAPGDDAAPRRQHGRARGREARLRSPVGVVEARLPAVEICLVDAVEEIEAADV